MTTLIARQRRRLAFPVRHPPILWMFVRMTTGPHRELQELLGIHHPFHCILKYTPLQPRTPWSHQHPVIPFTPHPSSSPWDPSISFCVQLEHIVEIACRWSSTFQEQQMLPMLYAFFPRANPAILQALVWGIVKTGRPHTAPSPWQKTHSLSCHSRLSLPHHRSRTMESSWRARPAGPSHGCANSLHSKQKPAHFSTR